jgi:hypothetical protein
MSDQIQGGYGWHNPWPFEWGGAPTPDETIYEALRSAVGNLAAEDDTGIDGLWRQCRAAAIAKVSELAELAVMQAFPQVATVHLELWEEYLSITPSGNATEEDRRLDVAIAYARMILADGPDLLQQLRTIDSRFTVDRIDREENTTTVLGCPYPTLWPAYSGEGVLPVRLQTSAPIPTEADRLSMMRAKRVLSEVLPAWQDFSIATSFGFVLDESPLDLTMLFS